MTSTKASQSASASQSGGPRCHPAFEWVRTVPIASLHVVASEYRHRKTGAVHYHLESENDENVFLVALRTVPVDSTGVAHILEHTALCGSEKYPVRDPFFMMVRRSLNTFMNAFTSSDWTAYPFASKNLKDFDNLLDVYLDAVFFSRLDPLDFAQEGHRLEFAEASNPESELVYRGVVYNEMKGAMSSPTSTLYQTLTRHLFPTVTYHFNSGGDPAEIPDLTYDQLKAFYQTHYHPSNSVFMTFGNQSAESLQERFETRALHRFERLDREISVPREKRYDAPVRVEEAYAWDLSEGESTEDALKHRCHIVLGWLLGESTHLKSALEAQLVSEVLLENSASPLRLMLETCGLGDGPSRLCGLEDSNREIAFMCGLEGSSREDADTLEAKVLEVIENVAKNGVPLERLQAILHQLELHQREIGGDHYPYGLQLILNGLSSAIHRGDPLALLNLDPVLEELRSAIQDPAYIRNLVQQLLVQNRHRVRITLRPDTELEASRDARLKTDLAQVKAALTAKQRQEIVDRAEVLLARQQETPNADLLPKVGLSDVPSHTPMPQEIVAESNIGTITRYDQGTNGLVYHQVFYPMPALNEDDARRLPLLTMLLGDLGAGTQSYLELQDRISATSGGVSAFTVLRSSIDNTQQAHGQFVFSSKALKANQEAMGSLLHDIITGTRFDEQSRIRELIAQYRSRIEQSITNGGHSLAMAAASSGLNPIARLIHLSTGLAGIRHIQQLDQQLDDESSRSALCEQLKALLAHVVSGAPQFLVVGETDTIAQAYPLLEKQWPTKASGTDEKLQLMPISEQVQQAWLTNSQVSFCARAYPTVAVDHSDAAPLAVLGGFLRNGFLHRAIRETGGAYGGGAAHDGNIGAFRLYSYRDPRLSGTLQDFNAALEWLQANAHSYQALEEAILGVIGSLDKPGSPAGEAKSAFQSRLFGRDDAFKARFRERILATTVADLQRVGSTYLLPERASTAVVTAKAIWESEKQADFEVFNV
ncbi:peptidase m16-like [gamma proteobacterium HdN1]|nr:peptidase m16-like [gamma proteobacterium HdN1]